MLRCCRESKLNISCVVVTHNSEDTINKLVDSLAKQSLEPRSIIVVDNASTDNTVEKIKSHNSFPHLLNVYSSPSNTGGAGGFRKGMELAISKDPDYVVTFDDDVTILDTGYLESLVTFVKSNGLEVASSLVVDSDNHKLTSFSYKLGSRRTNDIDVITSTSDPINDVKFFNGSIFKADVLRELKGPRPEFFIRGDEQEFRLRVLRLKYKIGVCKQAVIYHPSSTQEYVMYRGHNLTMVDHIGKQYFSIRNQFYLYSRSQGHHHDTVKMLRILFKSLYRYCRYYISNRDYRGLYIWLRAFTDGVMGELNSTFSKKIKQQYFE